METKPKNKHAQKLRAIPSAKRDAAIKKNLIKLQAGRDARWARIKSSSVIAQKPAEKNSVK